MGRARRREPGGIRQLLDLIEEHPDAIAYDWRVRFGLPASAIGTEMDWAESCSLARILLSDQSSWLGAKASGLDRPWPAEAWILANLYDLTAAAHSKRKPKPHPRPSDPKPKRIGRATLPQRRIRAELDKRSSRRAPGG